MIGGEHGSVDNFADSTGFTTKLCKPVGAITLLLLALAAGARGQADARAGKLQVWVTPDSMLGRTDASRWIYVKTVWDGAGLLEGRLSLEIKDGHATLGRFLSSELVLPGGEQSFRMLLPGLRRPFAYGDCEAHLRFVTAKESIELGTESYRIGDSRTRVVSLAASRPDRGGDETWLRFMNSLRLDRFYPVRGPNVVPRVRSAMAYLSAEDFPVRPHGYVPYDVAVLSAESFPAMTDAQCKALGAWVAAGGSACILCADDLPGEHRRFLANIAGRADNGNARGMEPAWREWLEGGPHLLSYGLGRIILAGPGVLRRNADGTGRRRMAAFLWNVREPQVEGIVRNGKWDQGKEKVPEHRHELEWMESRRRLDRKHLPLQPTLPPGGYGFCRHLLPESVRVVPLSVVAFLLLLLVVLIGPLEYWLLGLVRARPLTWIVFPAACLMFTWIIVATGNHYIGRQDHDRVLRIVDTDRSGRSLRENRLELLFPAKGRPLARPLRSSVFTVLDANRFLQRDAYHGRRLSGNTDSPPPLHRGRYPERYVVTTKLKQWRPELTRQLLIGTGETTPWKLPPEPHLDTKAGREEAIRTFTRENPDFGGGVYIAGQGTVVVLKSSACSGARVFPLAPPERDPFTGEYLLMPPVNKEKMKERLTRRETTELATLSINPGMGFLSVVSRLSPNGGGTLEDLHILDWTDKDDWLWITVTETDEEITMIRTLYRKGE